jgi:Ca2+-binding EF-hand superfamily protein
MPKTSIVWVAAVLSAASLLAHADNGIPKDKQSAADANAKQLLLLMDQDKNGKVSRQEYMDFMSAEFDRLDVNKDGELDVGELTQSQFRVHGGGVHR